MKNKQITYFEIVYENTSNPIQCNDTEDYRRKVARIREFYPDAEIVFRGYADGSYEDSWGLEDS